MGVARAYESSHDHTERMGIHVARTPVTAMTVCVLRVVFMHRAGLFFLAASLAACAWKEPPPATPPPAPSASASGNAGDDPNRPLTQDECASLAQSLLATCDKRGNARSTQIDRWCSDLAHAVTDGSWSAKTCVPRIRFIDAKCYEGASNVTAAMDCERSIAP
jgi:hypothetical protein